MVSADTLLSYPDWNILFSVHLDASDKQLGAVFSNSNKPIELFSRSHFLREPVYGVHQVRNNSKYSISILRAIVGCMNSFQKHRFR